MKIITSLLSAFLLVASIQAQELNCRVQVMHAQVQGTNVQVFRTLQTALNEMMNQTRWTSHVYNYDERIDCNIILNISSHSGDEFKGYVQVQSSRPVYGGAYKTALFNYKEKAGSLHFRYNEGEALQYSATGGNNALVSVLAFYANIILGLDYDSFSNEGGSLYFQQAQRIVTEMQSESFAGWKSFESLRNRYWLAEDYLNPAYGALRRCSYRYHRLGLDVMGQKLEQGRREMAESFRLLQKVNSNKPNSFLLSLWFTAKTEEMLNVFSEAQGSEKSNVYTILTGLDPANSERYNKLKQ